ncbi:MAG: porin family protein [Bacteroidota bacterium]
MKRLLVILTLLITFNGLNAQFRNSIDFSGGPRLGLNVSSITGDVESPGMKVGAHFGGLANINLTDNLALQPSLLFSMKGGKESYEMETPVDTLSVESDMSINYLEIPLNFVYSFEAGPGHMQVFAGGYFAYGISGKNTQTLNDNEDESDIEYVNDAIDADTGAVAVSPMDFGANAGLGYKMNDIQIQISYSLGFGNLNPKMDGEAPENKQSNAVIQFSAAYLFGGGRGMRYY